MNCSKLKRKSDQQTLDKKNKRFCKFQDEWLRKDEFKDWLLKSSANGQDDEMTAFCKLCKVSLSVKYDGVKILRKHKESNKHTQIVRSQTASNTIANFFVKENTHENDQVSMSELILTFHGVKHGHSYISQDCGNKLMKQICFDSKIAPKIHCGRTKAEAIVENILAPYALKTVLTDISDSPISIATDASNKGNKKMFPVTVRYYSKDLSVKTVIIDFYEQSDESSSAIAEHLIECLKKCGLEKNKLVAYGADNASVNFGKHKSVYQHLKTSLSTPDLVAGHCSAHIIHNAAKKGLNVLEYDVETFVLKVFSEFSSNAKRVAALKELFDFFDSEYVDLLRHTPTRFLTLFPSVDRVLICWPALKEYFQNKGEDECSRLIWSFFGQPDGSLPEVYVNFVHNIMFLLNCSLKHLESDYVMATEVYDIFSKLKKELQHRRDKQFFGFKATQLLKNLKDDERELFKKDAQATYQKIIDYLNLWFDYSENSIFYLCKSFQLEKEIELEDAVNICNKLNIAFDGDQLFSELTVLKDVLPMINNYKQEEGKATCSFYSAADTNTKEDFLGTCEKWKQFFSKSQSPNLFKIVQHIFAIPPNNAYVERVFSKMKFIWNDRRNRLQNDMVKAELFIHFNIQMTCSEFSEFLKTRTNETKELVACVKSEKSTNSRKFYLIKKTWQIISYYCSFKMNICDTCFSLIIKINML